MVIDSTTAHYGLFHIVFADAADHVAQALFSLRLPKEPGLDFSDVCKMRLVDQLHDLRKQLAQFKRHGQSIQECMQRVCDALIRMDALKNWRNCYLHASAKVTNAGYALFDRKSCQRLFISESECEVQINEAIKVIVDLEAYIPHLRTALDFEKEVRNDAEVLFRY